MFQLKTESVNSGYYKMLDMIMKEGTSVSPRGEETLELSPFCWTITNPRKRSFEIIGRWKNLGFQLAECIWILSGSNDLKTLDNYVPGYERYSDDKKTLSGAYGKRIFEWEGKNGRSINQLQAVYEKLVSDPNSRQGVIIIFDPARDYLPTRDVPCTNWFHFTIRNNKLNMTTVMRSNDAIWGTPYNMFNFMTLQEVLAGWLNIDIGEYRHFVDCLHIYKSKAEVLDRINSQLKKNIDIYDFFPPHDARLPKFLYEETLFKLRRICQLSRERLAVAKNEAVMLLDGLPKGYWGSYGWAVYIENLLKQFPYQTSFQYLGNIKNEFLPSILQRISRSIYRLGIDPRQTDIVDFMGELSTEVWDWVLENPIDEMEVIERR